MDDFDIDAFLADCRSSLLSESDSQEESAAHHSFEGSFDNPEVQNPETDSAPANSIPAFEYTQTQPPSDSIVSASNTHQIKSYTLVGIIFIVLTLIAIVTFALFYRSATGSPSFDPVLVTSSICILILGLFIAWQAYQASYYHSSDFEEIKQKTAKYVDDCNALNDHIEGLKDSYQIFRKTDYGYAAIHDTSKWRFKRPGRKTIRHAPNVYNCSRSVCVNASQQPFKYICKYFNIDANEQTLSEFEEILNRFEAAEQGRILIQNEKQDILSHSGIPNLIQKRSKSLSKRIGFKDIDLSTNYFPRFVFAYVSSGGNSSFSSTVELDIDTLNRFISYLSDRIKFRKSAAGQRALMTSKLRNYILKRDNYTCQHCHNSTYQEPNLLLEVDHILPISKGGLTTVDNLQVLCWRCNRSKGNKTL